MKNNETPGQASNPKNSTYPNKRIIVLDNACAGYGSKTVLHQISLSVQSGEFIAITGRNGSGKSTLLKLILGDIEAQKGAISVMGTPMDSDTNRRKVQSRIGYLAQMQKDPAIAISVEESVLLGRWGSSFSWLKRSTHEDRAAALQRLDLVGIAHLAHRDIRRLSGGQRQRVALARALVRDPSLLLMDEPTTYLDSETKHALMSQIYSLHEKLGLTTIVVTHEEIPGKEFERILHLEEGRLHPQEAQDD
jgi:ABC-type Mn2+/Zn2+ transport system ATPase subunit